MSLVVGYEDLDTSPVTWLVDGIIPDGTGIGFLWGASWSGKSLVAIGMSLDIGNGRPFMGHPVTKGRVVYLCGEGMKGIGRRAKARILRQEADDTEAIARVAMEQGDEAAREFAACLGPYTGDNFKVLPGAFPMHFTQQRRQPTDELQDVMNDLQLMNTPGPGDDPEAFPYISLVVLDSLENFSGELSISNRSSANRIAKAMHWMSGKLGCFVLAVAHPVADGSHMAGSNRLFATADVVIKVEPAEVAEGDQPSATVSCEKSKDEKGFPSFGYRVCTHVWDEPVLDDDDQPTGETEEVTSATVRLIEDEQPQRKAGRPAARPAVPQPVLRDPPPPVRRVRNGLRQNRHGLHAVPEAPAAPVTPGAAPLAALSAAADSRRGVVDALLAPRCPVCSRPGQVGSRRGTGCDTRMPGDSPLLLGRDLSGPLHCHQERILTAALAQPDPEGFLDTVIAALSQPA